MIKKALKNAYLWSSGIISATGFIFGYLCPSDEWRPLIFWVSFSIIAVVIISFLCYYCMRSTCSFAHNGMRIVVKYGNILEESGTIVIPVNEFFDTIVDPDCISEHSVHGAFLNKHRDSIDSIRRAIAEDSHLKNSIVEENCPRLMGNNIKYKLSSTARFNNYILYAFTHFDENNNAYITLSEYYANITNLWVAINKRYNACNQVSVPLMGAGITRFREGSTLTRQKMLQNMLQTFKESGLSFRTGFTLQIVLHDDVKKYINLNNLD